MKPLTYAVIGTGAIGGYYGGILAHEGHPVHFLFHSDYDYVSQHGLRVDSWRGNFVVPESDLHYYHTTEQMPQCDVVLVCLKTDNNRLLPDILPPLLHKDTVVVMIQNGLGIEQDVAAEFPNTQIAAGLAFICSTKIGPGHIDHSDNGKLVLAPYTDRAMDTLGKVQLDFKSTGVPTELIASTLEARWRKLIWNIPFNGLSVVLRASTDQMMSESSCRLLIRELMTEVIEAANSHPGVSIEMEAADQMMRFTDKMKPYLPSMRVDFEQGRPMEIESIYSRPIAEALQVGYNMRRVSMLEQQLRYLQNNKQNH